MSEISGFERRDVAARHILLALIGLFTVVALFFGVVALILYVVVPDIAAPPSSFEAAEARGGWRLEINPADDQRRIEAAAQARLQDYAWIDRNAGRVRVPIHRAMQILAVQGWPDQDKQEVPP